METLDLSRSELAALMGVNRQLIDEWLLDGISSRNLAKLGVLVELADILRYRLLPGLPAEVVRRPAEAYGGRTMLEVIAADEHEWLLQTTRDSFNFSQVA